MISPKDVQRAAKRLERENIRFRTFLKGHVDPDDLDEKFHELHRELFEGYDCSQCGNCCRIYSTTLEDSEISSIAAYLNMSEPDFTKRYLSNGSEGFYIKPPCPFLTSSGKCAIQECKPEECRGFPYTDKPDRWSSLYSILDFAEQCPVVFEMLERLKKTYWFRR